MICIINFGLIEKKLIYKEKVLKIWYLAIDEATLLVLLLAKFLSFLENSKFYNIF